jgi:hypothetical protein
LRGKADLIRRERETVSSTSAVTKQARWKTARVKVLTGLIEIQLLDVIDQRTELVNL